VEKVSGWKVIGLGAVWLRAVIPPSLAVILAPITRGATPRTLRESGFSESHATQDKV